jgi:hypothetical protein
VRDEVFYLCHIIIYFFTTLFVCGLVLVDSGEAPRLPLLKAQGITELPWSQCQVLENPPLQVKAFAEKFVHANTYNSL